MSGFVFYDGPSLIDGAPILRRVDASDGLSVTLTRTLLGTWRVVFCDTDADAVIESRVFSTRENAEWFASTLIKA